ncbi:MAG TPA: EAL domain-containing protein [Usitatibacter sp.]|nr:EAL domain-containing protein [Usitatibacter sp.]
MIGQLSSDSGFALVVPGYFVCAGILLYTGLTAAIVGTYRQRVPLYLAFAATCLSSASFSVAIASYYLADSVGGAIEALRWASAGAAGFLASIFVFVAIHTRAPRMRRVYLVAGALAAIFLTANFTLPLGTRLASVDTHGWFHMPWGESLFRLEGSVSPWNVAFRLVSAAFVAWAVLRLVDMGRRGQRRDAIFLAMYLLLVFAASFHGALIDLGVVKGFHLVPFAFVGLALLMSVNLVMRIGEYNRELTASAAELRLENDRRRDAEARIRERAFTDPLTGLPNRLFLQERLASLIELGAEGAHGAVLCCDLDHFKVVNDALSHEVGDQLLRQVATRFSQVAIGEACVTRMGGDQFMFMLEGMYTTEDEARARIERLASDVLGTLSHPLGDGARAFNLAASIGVATFAARVSTSAEVISHSEMALHRAKRRGRNNIQAFVPSLRREAAERFGVVEGLRQAIDAGELTLHYQPQVNQNGLAVGAEALMRWNSRERGPVPPATFIPIAEETGLIHALGEWSLREGCRRLARWQRDGVAFGSHLSINVSPWQLARPEFVSRLADIVRESGADPRLLTLEITESAVLFDVHETVAKLREIRPTGVRIALDDFGTGYSSLALIKDLPLDAIKIDQSFVRALDSGANKQLIRVVVAIGVELGLEVIAEGVETQADRDTLVALGCTQLQGFHFARPMAEAQFLEWLQVQSPQERLAKSLSI